MSQDDWMANLGVGADDTDPHLADDSQAGTGPIARSEERPAHLVAAPAGTHLGSDPVYLDPRRDWPKMGLNLNGQVIPLGGQAGTALSPELLGRRVKPVPRSGWRRAVRH